MFPAPGPARGDSRDAPPEAAGPDALVRAARAQGVRDRRLLAAMRELDRHGFVPPDGEGEAHRNVPIRIAHGQVTTQPSLTALMIEALELEGSEHVLEVGTGLGYQTALLARLCRQVWTVERWPDLADQARTNLCHAGIGNAVVVVGDGSLGLEAHAPYDAILVSAAFPEVPAPLVEQLRMGGLLVQPIGAGGAEEVTLFALGPRGLQRQRRVIGAHFVRLYGEHAFPDFGGPLDRPAT